MSCSLTVGSVGFQLVVLKSGNRPLPRFRSLWAGTGALGRLPCVQKGARGELGCGRVSMGAGIEPAQGAAACCSDACDASYSEELVLEGLRL